MLSSAFVFVCSCECVSQNLRPDYGPDPVMIEVQKLKIISRLSKDFAQNFTETASSDPLQMIHFWY